MNVYLLHYVISLGLTSLSFLVLGIFVYIKNPKSKINRSFFIFSLSMAAWSGFQTGIGSTEHHWLTIACIRPEQIGIIFIPSLFYAFIYNLLELKKEKILKAGYFLSFLFLAFLPTKLFIEGVQEHMILKSTIKPGPLYIWFVVFFMSYLGMVLFELFKAYIHSRGARRNQLKYLFWAVFIGAATGTTNFFYLFNVKVPSWFPFVTYGVILFALVTTYTIVKYRLMDISIVIKRTVIYGIIYSFSVAIFAFLTIYSGQWLLYRRIDKGFYWLSLLSILIITISLRPLDNFLTRLTDRFLFRRKYEYQKTLKEASAGMATVRDLNRLLNLIAGIITKHVRVRHATIFLADKENREFHLYASRGKIRFSPGIILDKNEPLVWWMNENRDPIVQEELNSIVKLKPFVRNDITIKKLGAAINTLKDLKTSVCVPCFFEGRLIGFLLLGEKLSGDMYTQEDLDLFMTLTNHAASAIMNCLAYQELKEKDLLLIEAEKLAAIGRLAGNIAHEIKNPLAPIRTYTEFLDEKIDDPNFRQDFKKVMLEETNRINHIVEQLLDYSHPKPLNKTKQDVRELIDNTLHLVESDLKRGNIKVTREYDAKSYTVIGDPEQLKQVFLNLFLNSIQALENISGRAKELRVSTQDLRDFLTIKIQDTGCGIKDDQVPFVFDPLFSTKEKGSGLGLSIVQSIIRNHGGTISVESQPETGTTFNITLPA